MNKEQRCLRFARKHGIGLAQPRDGWVIASSPYGVDKVRAVEVKHNPNACCGRTMSRNLGLIDRRVYKRLVKICDSC